MDDLRIGSMTRADWYAGQTKEAARRRSRHTHAETSDGPVDEVILSSDAEFGDEAGGQSGRRDSESPGE